MTQRIQTQRNTTTRVRPGSTRPVGELSINFADRQLTYIDDTPAATDLLPIRWHSARSQYSTGDFVVQGGGLYQARTNNGPKNFSAADWDLVPAQAQNDARYLRLTGGTVGALTLTGPLLLAGPPSATNEAATKGYVDGAFLPLTGGAVSGNITAPAFILTTGGGHFTADANTSSLMWDASAWRLDYTRTSGALTYVRGSDGASLFSIDPNGAVVAPGSFSAPNIIGSSAVVGGNVYARAGTVFFGAGDTGYLQSDGTNTTLRFRSDGYNLYWNGTNGALTFNRPGLTMFTCDASGNGTFAGNLVAGGQLIASGGGTSSIAGPLNVGSTGICYPALDAANRFAFTWDGHGVTHVVNGANQGYAIRSPTGGGLTGLWQIALNGSVSQVYGYYGTGTQVQWTYSPSDRRLKSNIEPSTYDALGAINRLQVRSFDMTVPIPGAIQMHWDCGLVADEVNEVMPIAYIPATMEGSYEMIRELPLTATLVRAVQQLTTRVTALETTTP